MEHRNEIRFNEKAATQVQEFLNEVGRANERLNIYVNALATALGVPEGWQLDPQRMIFKPPPTVPTAPPAAEGANHVAE